MLKYFLIVLAVILVVALVGCVSQPAVLDSTKTYSITKEIHSLNVEINAADFVIVQGDNFSVESNLKNLSVTEEDGVLKIVDKTRFARNYNGASLKLCMASFLKITHILMRYLKKMGLKLNTKTCTIHQF